MHHIYVICVLYGYTGEFRTKQLNPKTLISSHFSCTTRNILAVGEFSF